MKCKKCKRAIADNSIFCNWCGAKQLPETYEERVPKPHRGHSAFYAQMMVNGERVYVSAPTEDEYYQIAREYKAGKREIKKAAPKITLGTAIDTYINNNENVLSPSTINAYRSYRKTRFTEYMGEDINLINWQVMINDECRKVKPKTVHNAWRLVTAAIDQNPKVNLPKKIKSDRPWLDYEQIQILLKLIHGKTCEMGALLALHGLRRSEILHLTADDIDTDKGIIHVRGASVIGSSNKLTDIDSNKTEASARDVHIVIPRLTELLENADGKLVTLNPTTLYSLINDLCGKNNLPKVGVHGLRHSFASLAYHLGMDEMTVMREGGWSNPATVHSIYTHLAAQDADDDIQRMKDFYSGSNL